jgi:hypothetical protein
MERPPLLKGNSLGKIEQGHLSTSDKNFIERSQKTAILGTLVLSGCNYLIYNIEIRQENKEGWRHHEKNLFNCA